MPVNKFIKFVLLFVLLIICAAIADLILHWLNIVWVDRYLGIVGTLFIISGLYYSLRKKKFFKAGWPALISVQARHAEEQAVAQDDRRPGGAPHSR